MKFTKIDSNTYKTMYNLRYFVVYERSFVDSLTEKQYTEYWVNETSKEGKCILGLYYCGRALTSVEEQILQHCGEKNELQKCNSDRT